MAKISGVWKWKSQITCTWEDFTEYSAHFICNGKAYSGIGCQWSVGYHWFYYVDSTGSMLKVGTNTVEGVDRFPIDSKYNVINFGDEQEVDDDLYTFILANASPVKLIRGKWKWKEVILCNLDSDSAYSATFESNWDQFTGIWCTQMQAMHVLQYVHVDGYVITIGETYESANNYLPIDEKYRIMDFGKEQAIEPDLYDLIVSNAMCLEISPNISEKLVQIAKEDKEIAEMNRQLEQTLYGVDHGGKSYYDAFWDVYQVSGNEPSPQSYIFSGFGWNDVSFKPKYDICLSGYCANVFAGCTITDLKGILERLGKRLDTSRASNLSFFMYDAKTITSAPVLDLRGLAGGDSIFRGAVGLVTIEKIILKEDGTTPVNFMMYNCPKLENVVIEGVIGNNLNLSHDVKLSKASIESIINHLSDTASGKTLTLSYDAVYEAFKMLGRDEETGEEFWVGHEINNDWLELVASKSNWTITLV